MRAIVVRNAVMELQEIPDPVLRESDLLVRVRAAGVNRADLLQRLGRYPPPAGEPETIGMEIAGEVETAVGQFRKGDRVMALIAGGGYADKVRVPAAQAMPIPAKLSFEEAAAIPEVFLTAWLNLFLIAKLEQGEVVIVHAAGSGVGTAALQLCKGVARVVLATASPSKLQACKGFGATHVLARDLVPAQLASAIQAAAGQGADVILDCVGASYLEANIASLNLHGRLTCISTMGGARGTLDLGAMLSRRLTVFGSTLRSRTAAQKAKLVRDFSAKALHRFDTGDLRPVLARALPLAEAQKAHDALQAAEVVGKIVLIP
jgi:putative PIG3 family NAD(P)H quinone oxidoreductase